MFTVRVALFAFLFLISLCCEAPFAHATDEVSQGNVELGPRPFFLLDNLEEGPLKAELTQCVGMKYAKSDFSIGHRGACLQFPEHTRESYLAAARMGAGILECDVTFTKDRELVCRHSQCDLHTTTNILTVPELAAKCSKPFTPAKIDPATGKLLEPATAQCCTSDITLAEFKQLHGKMDAADPRAQTIEEYLGGTPAWRTDLYSPGTLMTHAESIDLFKSLGVKMTPELKTPDVSMPFDGDYSQAAYAQQMIDEYKKADVPPAQVFVQSFLLDDVLYWLDREPEFGKQAVYLDDRYDLKEFNHADPATWSPTMEELAGKGVRIIAPPMWMLVQSKDGKIVPSVYAQHAKDAGLQIITWTLERSGTLHDGGGWYYETVKDLIGKPGDTLSFLDVLAKDVGVIGVFSDWPATVTFYANCKGL